MKSLDSIQKLCDSHLTGNEEFSYNGQETNLTILEFWRWHYSELYNMQNLMAEFIVAKALGLSQAVNAGSWTLYDIKYRGKRIEVKETAYMHSWQKDDTPKSQTRVFGITKAHEKYKDSSTPLGRQNDIYVFCLNTGETRETSNPLKLENWEFYVVPTSVINKKCGDAKSISLPRLRKISESIAYPKLRAVIDNMIDEMEDTLQ